MKKKIILAIFVLSFFALKAQNSNHIWANIGPDATELVKYNNVGRTTFIEENKSKNLVYYGAATGGFWIYDIKKDTTFCTSKNIPGGVSGIAISPIDSNVIFVAFTFYANGIISNGRYSYGIYKSEDAGYSWTKTSFDIKPEDLEYIKDIEINENFPRNIYVITYEKIYYSENFGDEWSELKLKLTSNHSIENIVLFDNGRIAVSGKNCLYISNEKQNKWKNILPDYLQEKCMVNISNHQNKLFASIYLENEKKDVLLITENFGDSHVIKRNNMSLRDYVSGVWVFNDSIIFSGGLYLYYSTDNGNSFKKVKKLTHLDARDVYFPDKNNHNKIYFSNDGGVFYTEDCGDTWKIISSKSLYQSYGVAISNTDSCYILTGVHDNGTLFRDRDLKWRHILGGDGGGTTVDIKNRYFFANAGKYLKRKKINKSWEGTKVKGEILGISAVQNQQLDSIFYFCTFSKKHGKGALIRSTDFGYSFQDKDSALAYGWGLISVIEPANTKEEIVYFASYGAWDIGFYSLQRVKTIEDGYKVDKLLFENKTKRILISDIEVDDDNKNRLWITYGGFHEEQKIWFSEDEGENWINLTYNLPNVPVYSVYYNANIKKLFIGNDYGVFYLDENKWVKFGIGMPMIAASDITYNDATNELFVATYARGIWKITLKKD